MGSKVFRSYENISDSLDQFSFESGSLRITGSLSATILGSSNVEVTNFPTIYPVSGTIELGSGSLAALESITVHVSSSAEVEIKNDSGNPIPVTGSISTGLLQPLTDTELRAAPVNITGSITTTTSGVQSITGSIVVDNFPATQSVSIVSSVEVEIKNDSGNPVLISGSVLANTGLLQSLTNSELRAAPVEITGSLSATISGSSDVTVQNFPALYPITDNSGSITVDGTLSVFQTGSWNIGAISGPISLPTSASTIVEQQVQTGELQAIKTLNSSSLNIQSSSYQELQNIYDKIFVPKVDAFGLQEFATPRSLFDAQFTYDLHPLLYEQIVNNGTITHNVQNRCAVIQSTGIGNTYMQTYEYFRYQPGKAQKIFITVNFKDVAAGKIKFAQYGDSDNAIGVRLLDTGILEAYITTSTQQLNQSQTIDTGALGIDVTKEQICVIEFEALYVGTVKISFQLDNKLVQAAIFDNANTTIYPYIATANLPIRVGILSTSAGTTDLFFNCVSVQTSAGEKDIFAYAFKQSSSVTAGNGTRTHALSVRPRPTFNGIVNRGWIGFIEVDIVVLGNNPVEWEVSIGQALTGTTAFTDVNTTYSLAEVNTAGTLSGVPTIAIDGGSVPATGNSKEAIMKTLNLRYPITLNAAGVARQNGTITVTVEGIGGTSATRVVLKWVEIR